MVNVSFSEQDNMIDSEQNILTGLIKLQKYIEAENYSGYDPYDALKSPLFHLPFLRSHKLIRFGTQQFVKRFPLNLRPLLLIKKGLNPVTIGLCIQAYTSLAKNKNITPDELNAKANPLINQLTNLIPKGFKGACWGYDFDWESRYAKIPSYQPTIVATGIITNALFEFYKFTGNKAALDLCKSACNFLLNDINRFVDKDESICFSYSPFDNIQVFNASMKGVRLLSQVYSVTKDPELYLIAKKGAQFVINYQQKDGSWKYAALNKGEWIDNYHTGYVLDCLHEFQNNCNDFTFEKNIQSGFEYYVNNFFVDDRIPKFYNNSIYPIDCTAGGQSILTLLRFNEVAKALNVAAFMIDKMQSPKGYFYFRKYKVYTEKHSFMRWSNAWMFAALAEVANFSKP
ncbi:MAG: delta-aminolevulinic acid dehydratase [Bacteroidia bacterium]|nr:delta-aminolevulinic acid dehydratase [Bacteroidota bacterium]MBK7388066.1 delta-aminolevulinic acid dehydratase [Bacteroidota bacterium]MBP9082389.1 delta-aminolevulinic acid dehydratase [Bacteroidia bacterium]